MCETGATGGVGTDPDEELVQRARNGDRGSFEALVALYADRIYNLCYSKLGSAEDARDAAQDVFLRAYRALPRFEGKSRFYTWLFRIAVNCSFTRRKKRLRKQALAPISLEQVLRSGDRDRAEPADEREEPIRRLLRAEQLEVIHEAIAELPQGFQEVVLLRDIEGLAYEDIAEILSVPIGSVKSRLHRARLQLRAKLYRYLGDCEDSPRPVEKTRRGERWCSRDKPSEAVG
ncbi:RNA polymerase sigma factor [Planctomycetota bacterium]